MKIVILTRTGFHHTSFINRLQDKFEISCVVREAYPESRWAKGLHLLLRNMLTLKGRREIKDDLYLRDFHRKFSAGFRYHRILKDFLTAPFDLVSDRPGTKYLFVKCGDINRADFAAFLKGLGPDVIAVLGSSVISPEIIAIPAAGMINLHSGLSPYYRGTWSYGWPIVNREPEYIGATVHYVDPGIDSGDIIYQTRPVFDDGDDLNAIFLKVISEGIELVLDAIGEIIGKGVAASFKQPKETGKLYRTSDFNADAARRCISHLQGGAIGRYNAIKQAADGKVPLFGYIAPRLYR